MRTTSHPSLESKPWAKLRMSRKAYSIAKPWKRAGMKRELFEEILLALPDETIDQLKLEGQTETLLKEVFGPTAFSDTE